MYISTKEAAQKWGISERRVRVLCREGRVDGAIQSSWAYLIPRDAPKPSDGRQLRHLRQTHSALGRIDLSAVNAHKLARAEDLLIRSEAGLAPFIATAFSLSDMPIDETEVRQTVGLSPPAHLPFSRQLLVVNMHSALLAMVRSRAKGQGLVSLSEQRLKALQATLGQGLEGLGGWALRTEGDAKVDLEVLLLQDEREFSAAHPLERSLFWYAQLIRIAPFGQHGGLLAALVYAQLMIDDLWMPRFGPLESINELKAALVLTQRRGNYRPLLAQVAEAYAQVLA